LKSKILDDAKTYWLRYFPLEEMPRIAAILSEGYRNNVITENEALSGMRLVENDIKKWIRNNNILDKTIKDK
jgi:hypothetical protein